MNARRIIRGSALLWVLLLYGCASSNLLKIGKPDYPTATVENPVVQVMAMWQPTTGVGNEGRSCRGFAGQIFFITPRSPTPAEVDGEVTVWLFDDQGKPEEQAKPLHKFIFPAETWKLYGKKGPLGITYTVFVPYTRKGSQGANCSLTLTFKPAVGPTIQAEMASVELPGTKPAPAPIGEAGATDDAKERTPSEKKSEERQKDQAPVARQEPRSRQTIQQVAAEVMAETSAKHANEARKLSAADEKRIIREALARQSATDSVADDSLDDEEPLRPARHKRRNPLNYDDDSSADDDVEFVSNQRVSLKPATPRRRNPLMDDEFGIDASNDEDQADRPKSGRSRDSRRDAKAAKSRNHPLAGDDSIDSAGSESRRRDVLTISLSEAK